MDRLTILKEKFNLPIESLQKGFKDFKRLRVNLLTPTAFGSGISELASSLCGYFNELGLDCRWRAVEAGHRFFVLSKKISEALCLGKNELTTAELSEFENLSAALCVPSEGDILYLNDFHALVAAARLKNIKKIYRCHFDISRANKNVWEFFKPYIEACDGIIFTSRECHSPLSVKADYILPSIDPCSVKNTYVERGGQEAVLKRFNIPTDIPIVLQVSRFDRVKDPFGLIEVFKQVKQSCPCVLVYAGGFSPDDVNAASLFEELKNYCAGREDIVLLSINRCDYEIAALQSAAAVVVQKSFSESFGLSVTEALWKAKAVAASAVGGLKYQIIDGKTGLLCENDESFSSAVLKLLSDEHYARELAHNGREFVKEHFLITRELGNHYEIFKKIV